MPSPAMERVSRTTKRILRPSVLGVWIRVRGLDQRTESQQRETYPNWILSSTCINSTDSEKQCEKIEHTIVSQFHGDFSSVLRLLIYTENKDVFRSVNPKTTAPAITNTVLVMIGTVALNIWVCIFHEWLENHGRLLEMVLLRSGLRTRGSELILESSNIWSWDRLVQECRTLPS